MNDKNQTDNQNSKPTRLYRGLKPRGLRRPLPQDQRRHFRDCISDQLRRVDAVWPALLHGKKVSIDHVADNENLLIRAINSYGGYTFIIISARGWLPAVQLERDIIEEDDYGRTVKFSHTTAVHETRDFLLSYGDRTRIVAGILARFMEEPDWQKVEARRRY